MKGVKDSGINRDALGPQWNNHSSFVLQHHFVFIKDFRVINLIWL
jgi:hypothetical protein